MSDITYKEAVSVADLPIIDPIHAPCPDMDGCKNFDPEITKRSLAWLEEMRKKHGISRKEKPKRNFDPLTIPQSQEH